jgi:hypothetical protein
MPFPDIEIKRNASHHCVGLRLNDWNRQHGKKAMVASAL